MLPLCVWYIYICHIPKVRCHIYVLYIHLYKIYHKIHTIMHVVHVYTPFLAINKKLFRVVITKEEDYRSQGILLHCLNCFPHWYSSFQLKKHQTERRDKYFNVAMLETFKVNFPFWPDKLNILFPWIWVQLGYGKVPTVPWW